LIRVFIHSSAALAGAASGSARNFVTQFPALSTTCQKHPPENP
jgi:hypothetical protein